MSLGQKKKKVCLRHAGGEKKVHPGGRIFIFFGGKFFKICISLRPKIISKNVFSHFIILCYIFTEHFSTLDIFWTCRTSEEKQETLHKSRSCWRK